MNMKKSLKIILGVLAALILISGLALSYLMNRVVMNPPGTVGNTGGNLYNNGMFCEYDGTVYFANSFPNGGLFAMSPDESDIRRINHMDVRNILAGGRYLYYYQSGSLSNEVGFSQLPGMKSFNRSKLDGTGDTVLSRDLVSTGQLVDSHLYLMTSTGTENALVKVKIDKSEETELTKSVITPACVVNGSIYYSGYSDHYLHQLNTSSDTDFVVWEGNIWNPIVEGDYVYYMDVANNYRLCRYSLTLQEVQVLTEDRIDCFNVGGGYIYYQKNDADYPELKFMLPDGSNVQRVAGGNFTHINITSRYVYFQLFGDDKTIYHSPLGSTVYEIFSAAKDAAYNTKD